MLTSLTGRLSAAAVRSGEAAIRVQLMHSCPIFNAGLRSILSGQPDFTVDASAAGGASVIVADYGAGVDAALSRARTPHGSPVPLLVVAENSTVMALRHAIESGVRGYVLQGGAPSELVEGVRMLSRGQRYLCPAAGRLAAQWYGQPSLTRREEDVLQALASGGSDKVIARLLGIAVGTVKTHMKQLFQKLGVSTRTQAVLMAMDLGLLSESTPGSAN